MNFLFSNVLLVVYKKPINMHRSFNGLLTLAITELNIDVHNDSYILFVNRDRNHFKILFIHSGHISIFEMRLSGSMRKNFTKIDKIDGRSLHELIKTTRSRKSRLSDVLEDKKE